MRLAPWLILCFIGAGFCAKIIEYGNTDTQNSINHKTYRILILTTWASKSHMNVFTPVAKSLVKRGHEVTMITPYSLSKKVPGLKEELVLSKASDVFSQFSSIVFTQNMKNPLNFISFMERSINDTCHSMLTNPRIRELLKEASTKKLFDVVLLNAYFNECTYSVGYILAEYMVTLSPAELMSWTAASMGMSSSPATIPSSFLGGTSLLTFEDRITNTLLQTLSIVIREVFYKRFFQRSVDEFLQGIPSISELENEIALSLTNHDPVFHIARTFSPNVIAVPAMHCRPAYPLPKDLLDFIESSEEHGFILFSLGSIVDASLLPTSARDAFIKTFSQLKQKIIWKFEADIENLPSNVKLVKWIPQQDLLGHHKLRLFITHGGLFGLQEALYHGVPVIGIPLFADQPFNVHRVEELQIGLSTNLYNLTTEELLSKIQQILSQPSYASNSKKYSTILKDYPTSSVETATFWIEYIVRHQGAPHLKVHGNELYFFQYFLLDVIVVLFLSAISIFLLLRFVFRLLLRFPFFIIRRLKKQKTE